MSSLIRPYSVFEEFYRPFDGIFNNTAELADRSRWLPPVDITKDDTGFTIEMEVPGFHSDQVTVEAHDGVLCIEGERQSDESSQDNGVVRRERQYGKFARRFSLPDGSLPENIGAEVKDGVLHINIPHASPVEPKKIQVS